MAYFDEQLEDNVKATSRYKFCMSGKDFGKTIKAHMAAIGVNYTVGRVRAAASSHTLYPFFESADHESKTKMITAIRVLHAFDHYLAYNIRRLGPFFPPPNMERSAEAVIRYVCQMRGMGTLELAERSGLNEIRLHNAINKRPNASNQIGSLQVYEASALFEALGISAYIMPNSAAGQKDERTALPKKNREV